MLDTPVVWISTFDPRRIITFWKTGRLEDYETTIRCKDGTRKTIAWQLNPLDPNDSLSGFLTIGTDITHRKQLEDEIVRIERLKALGELAAGVSHNLNNMLTDVLGPAELLKLDIVTSATRARDLVRQLNQVVRRDVEYTLEPVDINTVINQAIRATRPRWGDEAESKGIKYSIQTDFPETTWVSATVTGVHDMLLNFIFNAVDAMPKGGDIHIKTECTKKGTRLSITDTGTGMDAETARRVFEPFFTTKSDVGTGMGLATVHAAIGRWGAEIDIQSAPGAGTTFTVLFQSASPTLPLPEIERSAETKSLNILIVEDDDIVSRVMQRVLSPPHTVTLVTHGQQACNIVQTVQFDLAFIDLGLPDQPGDQVVRHLKSQNPALYAILTTGWAIEDNDPRRVPFDDLMPKPATPSQILAAIARIPETLGK